MFNIPSKIINFDNTVGALGFVPELFSSALPLGLLRVDEEGHVLSGEHDTVKTGFQNAGCSGLSRAGNFH